MTTPSRPRTSSHRSALRPGLGPAPLPALLPALLPTVLPARLRALRRARRVGVLAVPVAAVLLAGLLAAPAQAATPSTWPSPGDMSLLTALLVFGGIPLALIAVITLLVMAPSLVRGDRQQRGVASWTEPQWFGGPRESVPAGRHAVREVGPGGHSTQRGQGGTADDRGEEPGGASARW